jgi:bifunctional non-homologous end joining protein LigD
VRKIFIDARVNSYWLKTKCVQEREFDIGGFQRPERSKIEIDGLHLGERGQDGSLRFVGTVRTGLSGQLLDAWAERLRELTQAQCPFANLTSRMAPKRSVWLLQQITAKVRYLEFTADGQLRHASVRSIKIADT